MKLQRRVWNDVKRFESRKLVFKGVDSEDNWINREVQFNRSQTWDFQDLILLWPSLWSLVRLLLGKWLGADRVSELPTRQWKNMERIRYLFYLILFIMWSIHNMMNKDDGYGNRSLMVPKMLATLVFWASSYPGVNTGLPHGNEKRTPLGGNLSPW